MQNTAIVRGCEAGAKLARDLERFVCWKPTNATQQRREILSIDELHRQEVTATTLADVVHAANIWMRNLAREFDFLMEFGDPVDVAGEFVRQKLEGYRLPEFQVFRPIHFTHAAAADQADDPITVGQHRPGNELRAVDGVRRR